MDSALTKSLIDALPLPVILVGASERVVAVNATGRALISTGEVGRHYITALRQPLILDAVEACLRDGSVRVSRYLAKEGNRDTTWRVTVAPVMAPDGRSAILSFEDVTALEEAGQMRRDFVANVSHELRTPLTSVLGFVETLKGSARNDAAARERFLDIMERELARMAQLVRDLLSLSRVEEEERQRPMGSVNLNLLVDSVVMAFEPVAEANRNVIAVNLPDQTVEIPGDAGQLRQVLNNLIENALKYGGPARTVTIELGMPQVEPTLRAPGVRIEVIDQGDGIAEYHLPRLTERFYRVDNHRSRELGGTGLGLAIVKHIVSRHRGRLRIDSKIGEGSRFAVILPLT